MKKTLEEILQELAAKLAEHGCDKLYNIVGPSGSGKSTLTFAIQKALKKMKAKRGLTPVESMTTRPPRYPGEPGHVYVTKEEFDKYEMVAYTQFDGNEYGVPASMLDECDLYVIDIEGVKTLRERYSGKQLVVIYLDITPEEAARRMCVRGDSEEKIQKRLANDAVMFADMEGLAADYIVDANRTEDEVLASLCSIIIDTL